MRGADADGRRLAEEPEHVYAVLQFLTFPDAINCNTKRFHGNSFFYVNNITTTGVLPSILATTWQPLSHARFISGLLIRCAPKTAAFASYNGLKRFEPLLLKRPQKWPLDA
jgi:hypothetical protein